MLLKENLQKEPIPLSTPLCISGEEILEKSTRKLRILVNKELNNQITDEESKIKLWLSRLEIVVRRDIMYLLTIDEAANIGLI